LIRNKSASISSYIYYSGRIESHGSEQALKIKMRLENFSRAGAACGGPWSAGKQGMLKEPSIGSKTG
jgi:hypothetical protein